MGTWENVFRRNKAFLWCLAYWKKYVLWCWKFYIIDLFFVVKFTFLIISLLCSVCLLWNRCTESTGCCCKREGLWGSEAVEASHYQPSVLDRSFHPYRRSRWDAGKMAEYDKSCTGHTWTQHSCIYQLRTSTVGRRGKKQGVAGTRYNIVAYVKRCQMWG